MRKNNLLSFIAISQKLMKIEAPEYTLIKYLRFKTPLTTLTTHISISLRVLGMNNWFVTDQLFKNLEF